MGGCHSDRIPYKLRFQLGILVTGLVFFSGLHLTYASLNYRLYDLAAKRVVNLQRYNQRVLAISFFQPGCPACRAQLKALNCVQEQSQGRVSPLAVGIFGKPSQLAHEVRPLKLNYRTLQATAEFLAAMGPILLTPVTLIFAPGGNIVARIKGFRGCESFISEVSQKLKSRYGRSLPQVAPRKRDLKKPKAISKPKKEFI